jgi:rRNA-processing protein FCF1
VSDGLVADTDTKSVTPNPSLVIIDTDALVQLLLVNEITPLRELKRRYKIQPAIVEAVDFEIRSPGKSLRKHISVIEPRLQKALGNGTILLLDGRSGQLRKRCSK